MSERRSGTWGLVALGLSIALVAAILWWPVGPAAPGHPHASPTILDRDRDQAHGAAAPGAHGIAPREVTTAAVGRVLADVVDEAGDPVDGGTVVLRCLLAGGEVRPIEGGTVALTEDGRLDGPGCRGTVCAELRHAALVPAAPWLLRPGRTEVLHAHALARIVGEVVDAEGEPVVGATIVVTREPGDDDPASVLPVTTSTTGTDADGMFSLPLLARPPCDPCAEALGECPEGPLPVAAQVLLVARAPGFGPGQALVDLDDPEASPVRVELPPGEPALVGTLADASGRAYPRAYVLARSLERPSEQHRGDAGDGAFSVADLGEGSYQVRAIQDGVELAEHASADPGDRVELQGPPSGDLVVEVVDERERAIPGARVSGGPFARDVTDRQGRVRAEGVAAGSYVLRIQRPRERASAHTLEVGGDPGGALVGENPTQIARIRIPGAAER